MGFVVFLVSVVVLLVSLYSGGLGNRSATPPGPSSALTRSSVAPLPVGTVIDASSVSAIQMFSATRGVSIATFWNKSFTMTRNSYLTTTVNGGTSWRTSGVLPKGSWDPRGQGTGQFVFGVTRPSRASGSSPRRPAGRLSSFRAPSY